MPVFSMVGHCCDFCRHSSLQSKFQGDSMDRLAELRRDFELLGELLRIADPSQAAAIARERRLIGAELERHAESSEGSLVDELAEKRSGSGVSRPPARRRKSG